MVKAPLAEVRRSPPRRLHVLPMSMHSLLTFLSARGGAVVCASRAGDCGFAKQLRACPFQAVHGIYGSRVAGRCRPRCIAVATDGYTDPRALQSPAEAGADCIRGR